jgi:zinc transporter 2
MMIWMITIFLVIEAISRVVNPPEKFDAKIMVITSIVGVICNIIMGCTLHDGPGNAHGHSHSHDHGHSHGKKNSHSHGHKKAADVELSEIPERNRSEIQIKSL